MYDERTVLEEHGTYRASEDSNPALAILGICFGLLGYAVFRYVLIVAGEIYGLASPAEFACSTLAFLIMCLLVPAVVMPVAVLALGLTAMIAYSVFSRPLWPLVAAAAGGLTGFAFTCYVFATTQQADWPSIKGILIGPVIATIVGQFGGAWTTVPNYYTLLPMLEQPPEPEPWLRFDIRQIMIATAWLAGILTLLKLTHILGTWSASIMSSWFVYQGATLWPVIRLVKKVRGYA